MLSKCRHDKDRFIKLLEILDLTYFGNVISLTRIDELFKKLTEPEDPKEKKSTAPDEKEAEQPPIPSDGTKMIDTTSPKPAKEDKKEEKVYIISSQGSQVPIKMIQSLVKLLKRDSKRVEEKSSFEDEVEFK